MVHTLSLECVHIQSGSRHGYAKGCCKPCYNSQHKNHKANSKKWRESPKGRAYERGYNKDRRNSHGFYHAQQNTIHSLAEEVATLRKRARDDSEKISQLEATLQQMEEKIISLEGQLEQTESALLESESHLEQALVELEQTRDLNGVLLIRMGQIEREKSLQKSTKDFISHLFTKYTKECP